MRTLAHDVPGPLQVLREPDLQQDRRARHAPGGRLRAARRATPSRTRATGARVLPRDRRATARRHLGTCGRTRGGPIGRRPGAGARTHVRLGQERTAERPVREISGWEFAARRLSIDAPLRPGPSAGEASRTSTGAGQPQGPCGRHRWIRRDPGVPLRLPEGRGLQKAPGHANIRSATPLRASRDSRPPALAPRRPGPPIVARRSASVRRPLILEMRA